MHKLAILGGAAIICATTHWVVTSAGGYQSPHAAVTIAIACGLVSSSIYIGVAHREGRTAVCVFMALCLLAGEAYTMLKTAERVTIAREVAAEPARLLALQRASAEKRLLEAKVAVSAETNMRLENALASQKRAELMVASEASKAGCASHCRALLTKALEDAKAERVAARAALRSDRQAALRTLADAETALAALPAPRSISPLADKLGIKGLTLDLMLAALASLALNGMGAVLIAFGAHNRQTRASPPDSAAALSSPQISDRDHAAKFALQCLEPAIAAETSLSELCAVYLNWCKRSGQMPLEPDVLGPILRELFEASGLEVFGNNDGICVSGLRVRFTANKVKLMIEEPNRQPVRGASPKFVEHA